MAVTLTATANPALSSELLLNGTLKIANAKNDGSESILVTMYNKTTGATYTATSQTYDKNQTLTFAYANGTTMSLNLSKGTWVYQRLSTEVGNTAYSYLFTFQWTDSSGNTTETLTVETRENVIVNSFSLNRLDDIDTTITGVCDVDIVKPQGVSVSVNITVNGSAIAGAAKTLATAADVLTWTFVDNTVLTLDLGKKSIKYTRLSTQVNDKASDLYDIKFDFGNNAIARASIFSEVGFAVSVKTFSANATSDTESTIKGTLAIANSSGASIGINVTHNGVLTKGSSQTFAGTITWNYADGTSLVYNTNDNSWTYTRVVKHTQDLTPDTYIFEVLVSNKYGSDSARQTVVTTVPKATILAFSADSVADSEKTIHGILSFELPSIAKNPTIAVNAVVNGVAYTSKPATLGTSNISFSYGNGSIFTADIKQKTFSYMRASDDVSSADPDSYTFELTITVNGESITQSLSVSSMAGKRVYDYEPGYPVLMQTGSPETQRTAWTKYIEENKRLYRLLNENLNYYENVAYQLNQKMSELQSYIDKKFKEVDGNLGNALNKLSKINVKAITGVAHHGDIIPIPNGSKRENCVCLVSLNKWENTHSDNKYTYDMYIWVDSNWKLTCYTVTDGRNGSGGTYLGYANYLVIDVTTLT